MIGKWIDSLSDEQRDRIIEHPDPTYDGANYWNDEHGCGCLTGCVRGRAEYEIYRGLGYPKGGKWRGDRDVALLFPYLTERFTPERMWRVVKARAASRNRVEIPEQQTVAA